MLEKVLVGNNYQNNDYIPNKKELKNMAKQQKYWQKLAEEIKTGDEENEG